MGGLIDFISLTLLIGMINYEINLAPLREYHGPLGSAVVNAGEHFKLVEHCEDVTDGPWFLRDISCHTDVLVYKSRDGWEWDLGEEE